MSEDLDRKPAVRFAWILQSFFTIYLLIAIFVPFLYKAGVTQTAESISSFYGHLCHQRIERSIFILGEESVFSIRTIDEFNDIGYITSTGHEGEIFAHDYNGDEEIGYKVALCVRDLGIYLSALFFGWWYLLRYRKDPKFKDGFSMQLILILMLPMIIDVGFQIGTRAVGLDRWILDLYYTSISKRIITGLLFGSGYIILIHKALLYKFDKKNAEAGD